MKSFRIIILSVVSAFLVSCGTTNTVPITGRQQSLMVSDGDILSLSTQQYSEFMKTAKLSTNAANTAVAVQPRAEQGGQCLVYAWRTDLRV